MNIIKLIIFFAISIFLFYISLPSLRKIRSHGFPRFFAWECIVVLILMNIDFWFENPFSLLHIVSWVLLIVSIIPAISGFYLLHAIGKPKDDFEATTNLVSTGIYKYIRHPLYASLICLAWGVYFKDVTTLTSLIVVVASVFLYVTAKNEEVENMLHFGVDYSEYMKRTKMFIPFVW